MRNMKRLIGLFLTICLACTVSSAGSSRLYPPAKDEAGALSSAPREIVEAAPQSASATLYGTPEVSSTEQIVVPDGTPFRVQLVKGYSSTTARVGDVIEFTVVDSVWVDQFPIIPQGMTLSGRVAFVTRAHRGGRNGQVGIAFDEFKLTTGQSATLRMVLKPRTTGDKAKTGLRVTGEAAAMVSVVGPLILVAPFLKGDEQFVGDEAIETVFLNGPLTINRNATTELVSPSDAGLTHIFYFDPHPSFHASSQRTLFCGQKALGKFNNAYTPYRFDMKPGTYWFSNGTTDEPPVKIDALADGQYLIEREHGRLSVKHFEQNRELIYTRRETVYAQNLSKLPEDELRLLRAKPQW